MPVARVERIKATTSGSVSTAFGLGLRPKSTTLPLEVSLCLETRPHSFTAAAEVRRKYPRRSKTGAGIAQEAAQESASGQESAPESARNRRRYRPGARSGIELRIGIDNFSRIMLRVVQGWHRKFRRRSALNVAQISVIRRFATCFE